MSKKIPEVSLKELIKSGAHFGHQTRRWNPKMTPFLHGERDGVHIFDITKTKKLLEDTLEFLKKCSKEKKKVMFVGTKTQARTKVRETAQATGSFWVNERWLGGTLTNFEQVKKSVNKLTSMKEKMQKGEYASLTKKERLLKQREIDRLKRFFGGIEGIEKVPDVLVITDVRREKGAVREAGMMSIPTIAIVDSNCDPEGIDYPIPMNDDATRAIEYVLGLMREAILAARS